VKRSELVRGKPLESRSQLRRTEFHRPEVARTRRSRRPSDAPFRAEVLARWGNGCAVCGEGPVQAAHLMAKSQSGPSVVENGLPLCLLHHTAFDGYRLQLSWSVLADVQRAWLAAAGYVAWDADGQPTGRGARRFAPMTAAQLAQRREKGGHHDR
jgi:hypothetical protein